jgi:hypothetical protein
LPLQIAPTPTLKPANHTDSNANNRIELHAKIQQLAPAAGAKPFQCNRRATNPLATILLYPARRFSMIGESVGDQCYRVEVSGWNSAESFFVEKASLEWTSGGLKSVRLKTDLRCGTIVFLRLLRHDATSQFPVAYQTGDLSPRESDGLSRVCLEQMHPREKLEPLMPRELKSQESGLQERRRPELVRAG